MSSGTTIIDAALRFARSNPELVDCAREGALYSDRSVDDLLTEAIARMRSDRERRPYVTRPTSRQAPRGPGDHSG